jgi:D-alanyl-D-alanine carboxypeptidase
MNRLMTALLLLATACQAPTTRRAEDYACESPDTGRHPRSAVLKAKLDELQTSLRLPGVSVAIRDRNGLWVGAAGTADAELGVALKPCTRLPIFSVSKLAMATTVLSLVEGGRLSLDTRVRTLLSDDEARQLPNIDQVTVAQLIGQTSGIPEYTDASFVLPSFDAPKRRWTWRQTMDLVRGRAPDFAPGQRFSYSNTNFMLAAAMLERLTGKPHQTVMNELLFSKLDAKRLTYRPDEFDTTGLGRGFFDLYGNGQLLDTTDTVAFSSVGPDGGIFSDAAGVVALLDALFRDKRLLSPASLEAMQQFNATSSDPEWAAFRAFDAFDGYGLGLIRWRFEGHVGIGHSGDGFGYQAYAFHFPDDELTFVMLANGSSIHSQASSNALVTRLDAARDELVRLALMPAP